MSVAQHYRDLRRQTESLIEATPSGPDREKLRDMLDEIIASEHKVTKDNVDQRTEEYKEATKALGEANAAIRAAKEDMAKVAETISKIAKAISMAQQAAGTLT